MRNTVSHLLSRLLNSGAAFEAPHARRDTAAPRQDAPPQGNRGTPTLQHKEPNSIKSTKEVNGNN
ncbi:hypothetical protein [Aeromonas aquatica]|uniref:hypothetical protein n=1 Tax=Aeromonas aquatica TaxID=558964 RepID=UPI00126989FD|nr:hypothetical protein [Aeromonas aquatica]